jgi:hypothetical protein
MEGIIVSLDHHSERGIIEGDDHRHYSFRREGMVLQLDFDRLRVGMRVLFTAQREHAINVERVAVIH